jgi:hypothetical protein
MGKHSAIGIYRFVRSIHIVISLAIFLLAAYVTLGGILYNELRKEIGYRSKYGEGWKAPFERDYGPVARSRFRVGISSCCLLLMTSGLVWLYRQVPDVDRLRRSSGRRQTEPSPIRSDRDRSKRYAFLGVASGVCGIGFGIWIALFPLSFGLGASADREAPIILGGWVLFGGYSAVIAGCYWWLKAKGWNEVLVVVGLLPLILLCIPFVRVALLAIPQILIIGMIMMPLILITVIMVLPDRSGFSKRRRRGDRVV